MVSLPATDNAGWWDGFARAPRGLGLFSAGTFGAPSLQNHDGKLYVHGYFNEAGGEEVQNIVAFEDEGWTLVPGVDAPPIMFTQSLTVFQDDLVALTAFGSTTTVQRLVGEAWEPLGPVPLGAVFIVRGFEFGGEEKLFIAGEMQHPDFPGDGAVFVYDSPSETWLPVGPGLPNGEIYGLAAFEGDLYVAILDRGQVYRIEDGDPDGSWDWSMTIPRSGRCPCWSTTGNSSPAATGRTSTPCDATSPGTWAGKGREASSRASAGSSTWRAGVIAS
jgi:hypothetical protein